MIVQNREKCLCAAAYHLKWIAVQNNIPQHIVTRSSFHCKATELPSILPEELNHSQDVNLFPSSPWLASLFCTDQVPSTIPGISGRNDPFTLRLEKNLDHISSYQVDCTIYTNGSTRASTRNGGAAAIISAASPTQPTVVSIIKIKGQEFTSSYKEDIVLSALIANHYMKYSHNTILEPPPSVNAFHPYHQPSAYNGCQDTPTSLTMTLQTVQQKKLPQLN